MGGTLHREIVAPPMKGEGAIYLMTDWGEHAPWTLAESVLRA